MRLVASLGLAFAAAVALYAAPPAPKQPQLGVVVEEVVQGSAAEKAGIKPGDILVAWERAANPPANPAQARGVFRSPFDVADVEIEQAPRGEVRISGTRGRQSFNVSVPAGDWGIQARPPMPAGILATYQEGARLVAAKETEKGIELWRQCAERAYEQNNRGVASWLYFRAGNVLTDRMAPGEAHKNFRAAIEEAKTTFDAYVLGQVWTADGNAFEKQNDFPNAESSYHEALISRDVGLPRGLGAVSSLIDLGRVARTRGNLTAANDFFERALAISENLAPESLIAATALNNLGITALHRGALNTAENFQRRALTIRERLAPGSVRVAGSLQNLGVVVFQRGDLSSAEALFRQSLAIREKLAPATLQVGVTLVSIGEVARIRGNLNEAEDLYRRALVIFERLDPGGLNVAGTLNNLAAVASTRSDLASAEGWHRRALVIRERLAPGSLDVAASLHNLGSCAADRGDFRAAQDLLQRALVIRETVAPDSLDVARNLDMLAKNALALGDLAAAENLGRRALAIGERVAAGGMVVADTLFGLAEIAQSRGDLATAENLYERALRIELRLGPGSLDEAQLLHGTAVLYRKTRGPAVAAEAFRRAVEALELQKGRLGGSEMIKAGFSAEYATYYGDYVATLLELRREREAFSILERFRAQSLLSMLAVRDLAISADVPVHLEQERKLADAEYDRTQGQIRDLDPATHAREIETLLGRLPQLRVRQEEIAEQINRASPKYASLRYPQPLDLAGTQAVLDPGTLLLSYSVGREKSFLFVVSPDPKRGPPLSVFTLPVGEKALRDSVRAFRKLIEWNKPSPELLSRSRSLYDTLLKPAEALIARADRILILPDGPLHTLPWAALVRDVKGGKPQYLVEWKPIHTAISATVYAELKKSRRQQAGAPAMEVVAFGDPKYPKLPEKRASVKRGEGDEIAIEEEEDAIADPQLRSVARGGFRFEPLPASRKEVEQIASLYAPRATAYLGSDATEEKAKGIGKDVPLIHYACHAVVNERFPLDSALVFTIPDKPKEGQDNGLLQAWEIFERVRIDADLVTLSACESGLGKEMGGEGLIGLTRAFQYAGARSILASLWKVEDESTGELMKRFYTYLRSGKTKDEALRLAQIDLIRSPNFSQPFHWAAFELIGDWK